MIDISIFTPLFEQLRLDILDIYNCDIIEFESKNDNSPLTKADEISNKIITTFLKKHFNYPIISEESVISNFDKRKNYDYFWLVDPLDGTKEFINKTDEFAVNIALIKGNLPVFGAIYIPVFDKLYFANKGKGAYLKTVDSTVKLNVNYSISFYDKIIDFNKKNIKVAVSRSHYEHMDFSKYILDFKNKEITEIAIGSSYKFGLLAENIIDIYLRNGTTSEWDIAAGQIIIEEAGRNILSLNNFKQLKYNKEILKNEHFIAF